MLLRPATRADLESIGRIQAASAEASHWDPADYLDHDCVVAVETDGVVAGFLVSRNLAGEREILNVAVDPQFRRRGVGTQLVRCELERPAEAWFLEVRESNIGARNLYREAGFEEAGKRKKYYENPSESAIVMRFYS